MSVTTYRRKPRPADDGQQIAVARYQPGEPLDDLRAVAAMAFEGEAAECPLSSGPVLIAAWTDIGEDRIAKHFVTVRAGDWLAYGRGYEHLFDTDTAGIEQFYEPVP